MTEASKPRFTFDAEIIAWRGPSPFFFAPVPAEHLDRLRAAARAATYGWGVVPVSVEILGVAFTTSLFPRDGTYLVPIKAAVRRKLGVTAGDRVRVDMTVGR